VHFGSLHRRPEFDLQLDRRCGKLCHGQGGAHKHVPFVRSPYLWSDVQHPQYFRNNDGAHSMKPRQIWDDTEGSVLVEFTVTLPLFLLLTFGLLQAGLLLYSQVGLQHGVEAAARCASVTYSANQILPSGSQTCFGVATNAVTPTTITNYAAQNSWGVNPSSPSTTYRVIGGSFNVGTCGTITINGVSVPVPGYQVTATYRYNIINYLFQPTLTAASCFPINVS
jgi:Flp pilus assembly protein TadG